MNMVFPGLSGHVQRHPRGAQEGRPRGGSAVFVFDAGAVMDRLAEKLAG
jgi:hypothetical protein